MWVITEKRLRDFYRKHPESKTALLAWRKLIKQGRFKDFNALKRVFATADYSKGLVIFDVGGNNYRIIADVVYNKGRIYIKEVLTHNEYDKWNKRRIKSDTKINA
jgi:mRNA interferase HigB